MKFLIQKINNEIRHDFAFTLIESIRFTNWLHNYGNSLICYKNTVTNGDDEVLPFEFSENQHDYIPIGSVEFVTQFLQQFHGLTPKPINVPPQLYPFAKRDIFVGTNVSLEGLKGKWFAKSNDKIKGDSYFIEKPDITSIPNINENFQISKYISIDSEWRSFIYKGKLVGLQHYIGEFTKFPDVIEIKRMIEAFKDSPISYTLDVGINDEEGTFVIEVHDFFSCGLYGFSHLAILPHMFERWFTEYINKNKIK
jgi:hypothetical protein